MNAPELKAFAVRWELRGLRVGFGCGASRIYAIDQADASSRARGLIARENSWPEGNIQVIDVKPIEEAAS